MRTNAKELLHVAYGAAIGAGLLYGFQRLSGGSSPEGGSMLPVFSIIIGVIVGALAVVCLVPEAVVSVRRLLLAILSFCVWCFLLVIGYRMLCHTRYDNDMLADLSALEVEGFVILATSAIAIRKWLIPVAAAMWLYSSLFQALFAPQHRVLYSARDASVAAGLAIYYVFYERRKKQLVNNGEKAPVND